MDEILGDYRAFYEQQVERLGGLGIDVARYPMGLEHLGFALGDDFDRFARDHAEVIAEQQDQGPFNQPLLITFDDRTSVKFHRHGLGDVVVMEGGRFDGFRHVVG